MFARAFSVFNRAQVDGYDSPPPIARGLPERLDQVVAFFDALEIFVLEGPFDAHYRICEDRIYTPPLAAFTDAPARAGTLIHEGAHATGAPHRFDRSFNKHFTRHSLARRVRRRADGQLRSGRPRRRPPPPRPRSLHRFLASGFKG